MRYVARIYAGADERREKEKEREGERERERREEGCRCVVSSEGELEWNDAGSLEIERLRTEAPRQENFTGAVKPCGPACRYYLFRSDEI